MTPIRLDQINLIVRDVPATQAFYARLGLPFKGAEDEVWARHHVSAPHSDDTSIDFDVDSTTFVQQWDTGWAGGPGVVIGFKVDGRDEVDRLVAELSADGVPVQQAPYDAFWGARYAVVSDPDGNGVGIMSEVDPAQRAAPPSPE
jgi:catechol 2,3-dioxygenase-like lactoylglutathione lyase family enzyme